MRVEELLGDELSDLHLRVLSGESHLDNLITHPRVQKPGLAFAGYYPYIKPGRVQIIGESETEYLKTLDEKERHERLVRDVLHSEFDLRHQLVLAVNDALVVPAGRDVRRPEPVGP